MNSFLIKTSNFRVFVALGLFILSTVSLADGVVTNGTTIKVHSGTYFIESGGRSIQTSAVFDIWGYATINGLLSNLGDYNGLIIESDINGTGSLIFNSGNPEATIERYLTDGMWHMVGPPVNNVLTGQYYFNDSPTVWLKNYVEPTDNYNYITSLTLAAPRGKGYACWVGVSKTDVIIETHGTTEANEFNLNSSSNPAIEFTDLAHGHNLIANPFSSAIDWDNPNWTLTNMEQSIWIWDPLDNGGNFKERSRSGTGDPINIIPSSQGFFVRASASNASITIPIEAKTHNSQAFYKSTSSFIDELSYLILKVSKGNYRDKVWVGFHEQATAGFDNGIDISKLMSFADAPQLYLVEQEDLLLSIDILSELMNGESRSIAMNFQAAENGMHQFIISHQQNLEGVKIFLEDLKNDDIMEIFLEEEILLFASIDDEYNRFILHFNPISVTANNYNQDNNSIYAFNQSVYISLSEQWSAEPKTIFLYDITGRLIYSENIHAGSFHKIPTHIKNQSIIVQLQFSGKTMTQKLIIQ